MKILTLIKNEYFWLSLILILGFVVRLYHIDAPIADWHSWRQVDTAAVTRNFIKEGFNPLYPKYDDMSGVAFNPVPNLGRFRFVEFPLYNIFAYPLYLFFGVNEAYHRLVTIISALVSSVFIYLIVKKYADKLTAILSSFFYTFLPFNVFFTRSTLPDPTFVSFAVMMIYFGSEWIEKEKKLHLALTIISIACAFLLKPWAIFFFLPLLYLLYRKGSIKFFIKFAIISFISIIPFLLWRLWILQEPQGIPASTWLLNGDNIRFKPSFFWWIISDRLGREILTSAGVGLFLLGIILKPKNNNYFLHVWLFFSALFISVVATGNVRHNYYQILFIPVASIFLSLGFTNLLRGSNFFIARIWTIPIAILLFLMMFYFGYREIKGFYQINNYPIVEAGKKADKILPKDAKVIAPYNGDTAFLYQTNRAGWAFVFPSVIDMIANYGATTYVSTALDDKTNWVMRNFKVLEKNDKFVIVDLTQVNQILDSKNDPEP